ncbi:MAG TPA: PRC-barrel domain-containing protein [Candidatus Norongarragalinales archaeon]|nr:PRC-barrel domain-containing protein [Candidatus Norongarragalinales archaeon]
MVKYVIAKQLAGKRIITTDGEELGRIVDLYLDEVTGKLQSVLLEPNPDSGFAARADHDTAGLVTIPYSSVLDVKDVMVVDRRGLSHAEE